MPRRSSARRPARKSPNLSTGAAFAAFAVDQLSEVEEITARAMFGGVGLYCGGVFFGVIARDVLYFKTDDVTRPAYVRLGMKPFMPYRKKGGGERRYYSVPLDVLESPPTLAEWVRAAVAAAERLQT